ncbi:transcription factor SPT20 homolog [Hermetia illucens]|uniref:transcription factor SPT20 homolog n=1 Tax=Hermetia illucens TaxID=343691 RepID=UPI0018CC62E5|nr:transcription factor SPT20 homolog [Hermetia illucens]
MAQQLECQLALIKELQQEMAEIKAANMAGRQPVHQQQLIHHNAHQEQQQQLLNQQRQQQQRQQQQQQQRKQQRQEQQQQQRQQQQPEEDDANCKRNREDSNAKNRSDCDGPHTANYRGCPVCAGITQKSQPKQRIQRDETNTTQGSPSAVEGYKNIHQQGVSFAGVLKSAPQNQDTPQLLALTQTRNQLMVSMKKMMRNQTHILQILLKMLVNITYFSISISVNSTPTEDGLGDDNVRQEDQASATGRNFVRRGGSHGPYNDDGGELEPPHPNCGAGTRKGRHGPAAGVPVGIHQGAAVADG